MSTFFLGIDCGATTSKVASVDAQGEPLSGSLRQLPTLSERGPSAVVANWINLAEDFLASHDVGWQNVAGVGLAIPGPYLEYGVLGRMPNMAAELEGWHFLDDLTTAVQIRTGRSTPVVTANDGLLAGLAEARYVQAQQPGGVLMLAPGSGLGCSFVDAEGKLLVGDHQAGVIVCHMPAPYERLGLPAFRCGCGRDWGCHEAYTSMSGLPQYLDHFLPQYPDHPLARSDRSIKQRVLSVRNLAQENDPLALKIFDTQAQALGLTVACAAMAYDPSHVVIGGGLIDPRATTSAFRTRYVEAIRQSASAYLWAFPEQLTYHQAKLGELSQAIGAALHVRSTLTTSTPQLAPRRGDSFQKTQ
ncbi:MAG: ROK family protein [Candidatus Competibacteraceae bacterium]|nr:ROK family protein [Candidatus Competibacteraceae bacterium]